ncbi:MAG: single-stranded DNA-binding protein [Nitriliruptorales bacterium]|nr:single-stranded DNA-binding protein [Nitriliruptorales bacterium]
MAFESNFMTIIGNLTDDPELRFTGSGVPVVGLTVAWNRKWTGRDGREGEETVFMDVNAWRDMAENVAESLHKGDRVVVIGRIKKRSYEAQDGSTRWVTEIEADEICPSLRWARATVSKTSGSGRSGGGDGSDGGSDLPPPPADDDVPF